MIEKMLKVMVVVKGPAREQLLDALGGLGVLHVEPVDPTSAEAEPGLVSRVSECERALEILSSVTASEDRPDSVQDPVAEVLRIEREGAERKSRLTSIQRRLEEQVLWGDTKREALSSLSEAGLDFRFYAVPDKDLGFVRGECVEVLQALRGKKSLVAVASFSGDIEVPESAEQLEIPDIDNPMLKKEASELAAADDRDQKILSQLVHLCDEIKEELGRVQKQAAYSKAQTSGLEQKELFAIQGWVPAEKAETLSSSLEEAGIKAGVNALEPAEDEEPPTLIRYASWAKPISALFEMLNTFPGYREFDLSSFFMIALPLFAAILIGDAGYGSILLGVGLGFRKKLAHTVGAGGTQLLIVIGGATLVFGVLSGNYFGITPDKLGGLGNGMAAVAPLWDADPAVGRALLMKLSFILGCIHLLLAHIRRGMAFAPGQRAIGEVGWCIILAGMLGLIWFLFFGGGNALPSWVLWCLGVGAVIMVLFTVPKKNPIARIGLGFASSIQNWLGAFSDTLSYIRLMAVGIATYYIAAAFNQLGADVASTATWVCGVPVLLFGHTLNIALALIAIFAHGVRLNMLEFSNNAGVEWCGYPYDPFAINKREES